MAPRKTKEEIANLSPEELEKRAKIAANRAAPKPAYLVYSIVTDSTGNADFELHSTTRSAEEALAVIDENKHLGLTYKRILIK